MTPCPSPSRRRLRLGRARSRRRCRSTPPSRGRRCPAPARSSCFLGVVRDHADGRDGVTGLDYEAYEAEAGARAGRDRRRRRGAAGPTLARVALLHRTGGSASREASVAVVVSSPHRAEAFDAARFCIDTLKETVPIWKQEH